MMKKITKKNILNAVLIAVFNLAAFSVAAQKQVMQEWNFTNNSLASELYNTDFGLPATTAADNVDETGGAKDNTYTINGSDGNGDVFFALNQSTGMLTYSITIASWSFENSGGNALWGLDIVDEEGTKIAYGRFITYQKTGYVGTAPFISFLNPDDGSFNNGGHIKAGLFTNTPSSATYSAKTLELPMTINFTIDFDNQKYIIWKGENNPSEDDGSTWHARYNNQPGNGYTNAISFNRTIGGLKWKWIGNKNGGTGDFIEIDRVQIYLGMDEATASLEDLDKFNFSYGPNPASNVVNVKAAEAIQSIEVYSILGQSVLTKNIGQRSSSVDISSLPKGIYIMKAAIGGAVGTFKFVKE
tara:strand:- start:475 stop:1545 length:1071 start_codon:yes stop_codon:yes gene_type:complete